MTAASLLPVSIFLGGGGGGGRGLVPGGPLGGGGRTPLLLLFFRGGGGGGGGFLGALGLVGAVTEGVGRTMVVVDVMEVCNICYIFVWFVCLLRVCVLIFSLPSQIIKFNFITVCQVDIKIMPRPLLLLRGYGSSFFYQMTCVRNLNRGGRDY